MSGCDLAMVMRISSGMKRFQPCEPNTDDPALDEPVTEADRPGVIVDTSAAGSELVRYGWDWSGPGPYPNEMRVELQSDSPSMLQLTGFKSIEYPASPTADFFWEPVPEGALKVPADELGGGAS
jgi:hypothetical protein